jgi:hypothetical protein
LIGVSKTYAIRAEVETYPNVIGYSTGWSKIINGTLTYMNPCNNPFTFVVPTQDTIALNTTTNGSFLSDSFTGANIDFYLNPFTVTPNCCTVEYTCESISWTGTGTSSVSCSDFTSSITFDDDGYIRLETPPSLYTGSTYVPGTYTVTFKGNIPEADAEVPGTTSKTTTFTFELVDPCDPPTSLEVELGDNNLDRGYMIGDP